MFQTLVRLSQEADSYFGKVVKVQAHSRFINDRTNNPIKRRWDRARRRRRVGRAYDMALEIAPLIPTNSRVLDVGCGSGLIAQHLSAIVNAQVIGIDLPASTEASIDYRQFDGQRFPVADESVDAVLFSYVLHHMQNLNVIMKELQRVLTSYGLVLIYEDIPACWWDRMVCSFHNLKWRKRTGVCTFRNEAGWRTVFNSAGLEVVSERRLSRWRNFAHPVCRRLYLLRLNQTGRAQRNS